MVITLKARLKEKLVVEPDPAIVDRATPIEWALLFEDENLEAIRWEIYFRRSSPFKQKVWEQTTKLADNPSRGGHKGVISAGSADEPGEHKYGVRITNPRTMTMLSDDDPWIIVRG